MLVVVLIFLFVSIYLYILLGGADFGIGILELFSSKKDKETTKKSAYRVIGPVWEANHVWLIISIVILWIAFPPYFEIIMIYLHIPITLALLGIISRGVSFVFRHYDAVLDNSQHIYDKLFEWSSLLTPLFLGVSFATLTSGDIRMFEGNELGFQEIYVKPWLSLYTLSCGLFFSALCAFNSSVFMIGETSGVDQKKYKSKARITMIILFALGLLTLITSIGNDLWIELKNKVVISTIILAGGMLCLFFLWKYLGTGRKIRVRVLTSILTLIIFGGLIYLLFPKIVRVEYNNLNILYSAASEEVIYNLGISLLIGGSLILPGLFHLLRTFGMLKVFETED